MYLDISIGCDFGVGIAISSVYFRSINFCTTDALPAILKFSEQAKEILVVDAVFFIDLGELIGWYRIHVWMDEMYETAQQAKHRIFGIDKVYKIANE